VVIGSLVLGLALAVDPGARSADISGGALVELRGGWAPVLPGQPQEAGMLLIVQPNVDLRVRDRRRGVFLVGAAPRMLMRQPNPLRLDRPLFLGTMHASYNVSLTRRWDFGVRGYSVVGELDYTSNALVLGPVQGTTPGADVTKYAIVDFAAPITGRLTRRNRLNITPSIGYRTPFGPSLSPITLADGRVVQPLPQFITANLAVADQYTASDRDMIEPQVRVGYVDFDPGAVFLEAEGRLGWDRTILPRVVGHIDAGVLTAQIVARQDDMADASSRTLPVGTASLFGELVQKADVRLDGTLGAAYIAYFDPILARLEPRAGGFVQLAVRIPPEWRVGVRASVYTAANRSPRVEPVVGPGPMIDPDETFFAFDAPVTYRINDNMAAEVGAIVTTRAPHFRSDQFEVRNTEVWGYVAFRFAGGTARGAREVERRDGPIGTGTQQLGIGAGGLNSDRVARRVNRSSTRSGNVRRGDEDEEDGTLDRRRRMQLERERRADGTSTPIEEDVGPPAVMQPEPTRPPAEPEPEPTEPDTSAPPTDATTEPTPAPGAPTDPPPAPEPDDRRRDPTDDDRRRSGD